MGYSVRGQGDFRVQEESYVRSNGKYFPFNLITLTYSLEKTGWSCKTFQQRGFFRNLLRHFNDARRVAAVIKMVNSW
jgi:hypothetical protein